MNQPDLFHRPRPTTPSPPIASNEDRRPTCVTCGARESKPVWWFNVRTGFRCEPCEAAEYD